jgi:uncharacterized protein (DUF1697 family)
VSRWIAFLRAINVGGHSVKMDRFRQADLDKAVALNVTFLAAPLDVEAQQKLMGYKHYSKDGREI